MNTTDFVLYLRSLDIRLIAENGKLRCNAPQDVLTPELRSELAERKAEILLLLKRAQGISNVKPPPVVVKAQKGELPLSLNQQRLWLLERLAPGTSTYNIPLTYHLIGRLNSDALKRSLDEIIRRHEILRTTFADKEGQAVQVVSPKQTVNLQFMDSRDFPEPDREVQAREQLAEIAVAPFDLQKGSLLRAALLRLDGENHLLLIVIHHIAFDVWSVGVFNRELATLYGAFIDGKTSPLAEPALQYADFARWQRQWVQGEVLQNQLDYWKEMLAGSPPVLELPIDHPRPSIQTFNGKYKKLKLAKPLVDSLKKLSQQEGATLFMTMLAGFKVLLHRYTGQEDISVGSPIANRSRVEFEELVGFFVNTLVLRTSLSGMPTFREFLIQVRQVALGAYANQDLPFEKLVEELQPQRNMSHTPLFQVMFILEQSPAQAMILPGLTVKPVSLQGEGVAKFDMSIYMSEEANGITALLEYNRDLFADSTIVRFLNQYRNLLEGLVANPDQRIIDLPIISELEREEIVTGWNQTVTSYPSSSSIQDLFVEQVVRSPDAIALEFGDQSMSYHELNHQANQLAHYLLSQGVGPEVKVGICMERSMDMVIAILGILKAGGAYVPLDPDYPSERLAFMLEDTAAPVLLTDSSHVEHLPEYGGSIVCLDTEWDTVKDSSTSNPASRVTGNNLAYVMYTSGSTGQPKGVCIEHRGVVRLVKNTNYVDFGPDHVFLQFAPISFDASTFELWGSLLNGARLVLAPPGKLSLEELGRIIVDNGVTTLWLTAALFHQMVDTNLESLKTVRQLLAGGETLSVPHVKRMIKELGDHRLINGYGPTENTTFTACHIMTTESGTTRTVPIGKPIANTQAYILDRYMQPVSVGVYGELHIGGDGLARGYLNRPDLTAECFVPHPFSDEPGGRLYKTGDMVRYLEDGSIEFQGRIDNQVKIRGFRIELGEVEAALLKCPGVKDAVVLCREDTPGEKQLAAYLAVGIDPDITKDKVRNFVQEKLSHYMVPVNFVLLDTLPLTANGKIDRDKLQIPDSQQTEQDEVFSPPHTPTEKKVAKMWTEILNIDQVGIYDNFFDLGGHSLLATQLTSRILTEFQVELPLVRLFENPTLMAIAEHVDGMCMVHKALQPLKGNEVLGRQEGEL